MGAALAELATDVLSAALAAAGPAAEDLAVIGMGKLGGAELNYSSDVDILFVSPGSGSPDEDARAARAVLDVARTCFRVDVDLRPEGRDGPLVRSLASYEAYWDRWAQTWEFQALLKARPAAGDATLGDAFAAAAQARLWDRPFTADDLRAVRSMKARAEAELARKGLTDREVKRGRGGIRDIEFSVQLLQLVHGRHDPALRSPTTLDALGEMGAGGYVDPGDARALDYAYRLLRTVEHRLQLVAEQQVHTLPTTGAALDSLARVMGYRDTAEAGAGELLAGYLSRQQATVRAIHEHLFFRPLLDQLTRRDAALPDAAVTTRLAAFGFTDAARTRQALHELTRGLTRSSRLMQQMLPLLLGWLSESPDPDLGLLGLRILTSGSQQATEIGVAFRESPEAARRLCVLLGTGRLFAETLEHQPDLIPSLGHPDGLAPRPPGALLAGTANALAWREHAEDRQHALLRYKRREQLRVAAADVLDLAPASDEDQVVVTAGQLTALAEACVSAALDALEPPLPFAVIAMGRFGGAELSYASDLDLLFVYEGTTPSDFAVAERLGESLVRFLAGVVPSVTHLPGRPRPAPGGQGRSPGPQPRWVPRLLRALGPHVGAPGAGPGPPGGGRRRRGPAVHGDRRAPRLARRRAPGRRRAGDPSHEGPHRTGAPPGRRGPSVPPQAGPGLAVRRRVLRPAPATAARRAGAGHHAGPRRSGSGGRALAPTTGRCWPRRTGSASGPGTACSSSAARPPTPCPPGPSS